LAYLLGTGCHPLMYAISPTPINTTPSIDAYGRPAASLWSCGSDAPRGAWGVIVLALESVDLGLPSSSTGPSGAAPSLLSSASWVASWTPVFATCLDALWLRLLERPRLLSRL